MNINENIVKNIIEINEDKETIEQKKLNNEKFDKHKKLTLLKNNKITKKYLNNDIKINQPNYIDISPNDSF